MKCDIRTVINLDDEDLVNLVEKCKEKHKLSELIERALVAYCYQSSKAPESKRLPVGEKESQSDLAYEIRSLAMQLATLSNNVQSNHAYTIEAIGRLGGEIDSLGQRGVVQVVQQSIPDAKIEQNMQKDGPLTKSEIEDLLGGVSEDLVEDKTITDTVPDTFVQDVTEEIKEEPKKEKVAPTKKVEKPEKVAETESTTDTDDEDDDDVMSEETKALLAQFLGG